MILVVTWDGKAVDVAYTLRALGRETMVTGLVDAETGAALRRELLAAGLRESLFDLAGPRLSVSDWADFLGGFYALAARASTVVVAGGLPAGFPADAFAQLKRTTPTPVLPVEDFDAHADR